MLRKSQPQFREKVRKLRLRKKSVFLIKKKVYICLNLMRPHVMEQVRNFRCTLSFNKEPRYKEPICKWWLVICENSRWAPQAYSKMGPFSKPNFTSRNFNSELYSYAESSWWLILAIHHMQDFYQNRFIGNPGTWQKNDLGHTPWVFQGLPAASTPLKDKVFSCVTTEKNLPLDQVLDMDSQSMDLSHGP